MPPASTPPAGRVGLAYCPFGNREEALAVARQVVEEKLAVCANILGAIESVYLWQGRIEQEGEVAVLFKTAPQALDNLVARIAELHSYDVPAVVGWIADNSANTFSDWTNEVAGISVENTPG